MAAGSPSFRGKVGDKAPCQTWAALVKRPASFGPSKLPAREALAWLYMDKLAALDRPVGHLLEILRAVPDAPRCDRESCLRSLIPRPDVSPKRIDLFNAHQ